MTTASDVVFEGFLTVPGARGVDPETYLPLREAAALVPLRRKGKCINVATIWRWCNRGVRGRRLPSRMIGGTLCVRVGDLFEFVNAPAGGTPAPIPSSLVPATAPPASFGMTEAEVDASLRALKGRPTRRPAAGASAAG